jgi:hypothetical protein
MILTGENWKNSEKSVTLSTTNPVWADPDMSLGLHGERPPEPWLGLFYIEVVGVLVFVVMLDSSTIIFM